MGIWSLDPVPLAAAAAALMLYGQAFARVRRRRRDLAGRGRAALFASGVLVAVLALVSPIDGFGEDRLLSAHMAQHLLLADVAPLLIVLGLRGPMSVLRSCPPPASWRSPRSARSAACALVPAAPVGVVRGLGARGRGLARAGRLRRRDRASGAARAEHATLHARRAARLDADHRPDAARPPRPRRARALFAAAVLVAGMGLSEALLLAAPLYPHYEHVLNRPFGFTAAEDQRRAGLLMMAEQIATLGTAAALLLWSHAERVERELAAS